ncbi:MAG: FecR domain-containing protein [Bdellovibrionaceae bacterium]|nr:FecR domain-containing protein [Pseudobdellovibrionaceae bacterium]
MRNLALLGAVFLIANLALPSTAQAAGCGTAEVVKGKVEIKRGSQSAVPLAQGEKVCAGDQVTTAADSRVKLSMADGNVLNVNPGTSMKIETYENDATSAKKKVLLNVMYGKMRATVNQKYDGKSASGEPQLFQVKTKSAVAGVRGTDFLTSFAPKINKMEVITFEGKVEVGQAGPGGAIMNAVAVGAGQKTEASVGQPPAPPKAVPASELKQMDSNSQAGNAGERPQPNANAGSEGGDKEGDKKGANDQAAKGPEDQKQEGDGKKGAEGDGKNAGAEGGEKRAEGDGKKGGPEGGEKRAEGDGKKGGPEGDGKKNPEGNKRAEGDSKKGPDGGDKRSGGDRGQANNGGSASGGAAGGMPAGPGDSTSGGESGTTASAPASRMPASSMPAPSPGMMMPIDADTISGGLPAALPTTALPPPTFLPPIMPVYVPPTCDYCNQVVNTGPARVNVKICLPNQGC